MAFCGRLLREVRLCRRKNVGEGGRTVRFGLKARSLPPGIAQDAEAIGAGREVFIPANIESVGTDVSMGAF